MHNVVHGWFVHKNFRMHSRFVHVLWMDIRWIHLISFQREIRTSSNISPPIDCPIISCDRRTGCQRQPIARLSALPPEARVASLRCTPVVV